MPGTGFGGMLANLFNPGLDQQVAASITPNANPLAQQDQSKVPPVPGAPSNPAPGQAPPQVTQPDPTLAQTNQLLMRAYQTQNAADSFNQGLQRMAAGYGTAQQQASKQAALAGGGGQGGGQGYLDAIAKMQGIDAQQTAQTEHAQFQANVGVLANSLFPNDPDAVAKAQEVARNPEMLQQMGQVMATGMTPTDMMRNTDAAAKAYAAANPNASQQDIAQFKSNLLSYGAMGGDSKAREYMQAKQTWLNDPANKGQSLPPELMTQASFEAAQAGNVSKSQQFSKDVQADQANFARGKDAYDRMINDTSALLSHPGLPDIVGPANQFKTAGMPGVADSTSQALALYNKIMAGQYVSGVQDFHGAGRITQTELAQDAPSQSVMKNRNLTPESFQQGGQDYIQKLQANRAQLFGQAGQLANPDLTDKDYDTLVNSIYKPGGAQYVPGQASRQPPATIQSAADIAALPHGRAFVIPSGPNQGKVGYAP